MLGLYYSIQASLVEARGLSLVAACWFSHLVAYGILVPQPGIKPESPALAGGFSTTGPPGKPPTQFLQHPAETNDSERYQGAL